MSTKSRPVKERLNDFREKYPEGAVETEVKAVLDQAFFVAKIYADFKTGHLLGTGHFLIDDSFEGAETLAVGRALGNAGFRTTTEEVGSSEEYTAFEESQNAKPTKGKVRRPGKRPATTTTTSEEIPAEEYVETATAQTDLSDTELELEQNTQPKDFSPSKTNNFESLMQKYKQQSQTA